MMKIATWNVNGIRARQAELQEFIEREAPDVICLQEIKAAIDQLPVWLCELEGYWCYWHGGKGYSGVGLHVRKATCPDRPAFQHPEFDYEHRIVAAQLPRATVASIYVPNGGKDFPAKMRFLEAMDAYAAEFEASGRPLDDVRRFERRTDRHGRPSERAEAARHRPAAGGARAHRADHQPRACRRAPHARPGQRGSVHVVGAVAEHEAAQHRVASRLRACQRGRSPSTRRHAWYSARWERATTAR